MGDIGKIKFTFQFELPTGDAYEVTMLENPPNWSEIAAGTREEFEALDADVMTALSVRGGAAQQYWLKIDRLFLMTLRRAAGEIAQRERESKSSS